MLNATIRKALNKIRSDPEMIVHTLVCKTEVQNMLVGGSVEVSTPVMSLNERA